MSVIVYERTADCTRIMHGLLQLFLFFFHLLCSGVPPYGQVGRANELDVFFKKAGRAFHFSVLRAGRETRTVSFLHVVKTL